MSWPLHLGLRRAFALICLVALPCNFSIRAASFAEERDYKAAVDAFNDAIWDRAETEFAKFVTKYPKSEHIPEAALLQAQAQFNQKRFAAAIASLTTRQSAAGQLADRYAYWIGEAQFANSNFTAAAEAFGRVTRDYPASSRLLAASVGEAAARAKLGEWPRVIGLLQKPDSAFQQVMKTNSTDEIVARGRLLLAEAGLAQTNFPIAKAALQPLVTQKLKPELDWQRTYLQCRLELGLGKTNEALHTSEQLITTAGATHRPELLAESVALDASILEQLGQATNAVAAFERNLKAGTPLDRQQEALLKITQLMVAQNQVTNAIQKIEQFLQQSTNAPLTDATAFARLTLGELHLKVHNSLARMNLGPPETNHLQLALTNFDQFISTFTNSPLVGKAELGRGWALWEQGKTSESLAAFQIAVTKLPPSEDLAEAHFKLADAQFAQNDFTNALQNYQRALILAANLPDAKAKLTPQILHQIVRTGINLANMTIATNALEKILQAYSNNPVADRSLLLVGQGFADLNQPDEAQSWLAKFIELYPKSSLRPEADLGIARTCEQKRQWTIAIADYDNWLKQFPSSPLRPQAEFQRAWANAQAGNETNALNQFTNFVARFATNAQAPQAQWWIADHYYNQGDYVNAEKNYKSLFQTWPSSKLASQACIMAGRAAVNWQNYAGAIECFTNLTSNPNCPSNLWSDAMFLYGGTLMLRNSGDTNNPKADLQLARDVFGAIRDKYPNTEQAAEASGEVGNCFFQLAAQDPSYYTNAIQAYQQVISSPHAGITVRSEAQVGLGRTLEAQARHVAGGEHQALLKQALANYLDVFYKKNLSHEGEQPALFWVEKAGLGAARLLEASGEWTQAVNVYQGLEDMSPALKDSFESNIQKAQAHIVPKKK